MSRRNHLHDKMRWRAVGMLYKLVQDNLLFPKKLNVTVVSSLAVVPLPRDSSEDVESGRGESPQRQTSFTCCNVDAGGHNSATAGVAALCCCRKGPIPPSCVVQSPCRRCSLTTICCLCLCPRSRQVALGP
ncbi:hypothetical protein AVEN_167599-1 [Araneus ventricosus]|uniref:Uncharacterized protein n=1 Tax=Araneus ventricosus TaxID=182803 RepID=A0A4Y2HT65_ARAVE|nr:hypothetical protein AVEN_167599-1 [Araneus ventricosus]